MHAGAHFFRIIVSKLNEVHYELVTHPPDSPDLATSELFHSQNWKIAAKIKICLKWGDHSRYRWLFCRPRYTLPAACRDWSTCFSDRPRTSTSKFYINKLISSCYVRSCLLKCETCKILPSWRNPSSPDTVSPISFAVCSKFEQLNSFLTCIPTNIPSQTFASDRIGNCFFAFLL